MSKGVYLSTTEGKNGTKPAACGCHNNEEAQCALAALSRPRFYYGQLLTDQELTALSRWTQDKVRLARYVQGWGVVCGLEVEPAAQVGQVTVKAGYARNCCGYDIVVEQDVMVDLSAVCQPKPNGCADPTITLVNQNKANATTSGSATATTAICGQNIATDNLFSVDLLLFYQEVEDNLQTSLARAGGTTLRKCEPGRIRETYQLDTRPVIGQTGAMTPFAAWQTAYKVWLDKVAPLANDSNSEQAQLCQMMQRFHHAPGIARCASCGVDSGVPLARIWLENTVDNSRPGKSITRCKIAAIDTYPPYRRPLLLDELPAPSGKVNLARFLWQRLDDDYDEVRQQLHTIGFHIISTSTPLEPKAALDRVRADADPAADKAPLCASRAVTDLTTITVDLGVMGKRIIGFDQAASAIPIVVNTASAPAPAPAPTQADDLTKIRGVGSAYAQALTAAGYTTYATVANLPEEELLHVLQKGTKLLNPISPAILKSILASAQELAQGSK